MAPKSIATVALVALLVSAGAAVATPANAAAQSNSAHPASGNAPGEPVENPDENASDPAANASAAPDHEPGDAADDRADGPPVDVPSQVPDHVVGIHRAIVDFLSGGIDDLGGVVSDLTPGGSSNAASGG